MTDKALDAEAVEDRKEMVAQNQGHQFTPMDLIRQAQDSGADLDRMEQLFNLQLRWEENEARKAFNEAFADFKAESIKILKDKKVGYTNKDGSFTGYAHATIGNVVATVVPILGKHGLSHRWDVVQEGGNITVTCRLSHTKGHSETVSMVAGKDDTGKKNAIQQVASTTTYLQRYTLLAITGLATEDQPDDDGRGAEEKEEPTITESQAMDLDALATEVGADVDKFLVYLRVATLMDIKEKDYSAAVHALEARRKTK